MVNFVTSFDQLGFAQLAVETAIHHQTVVTANIFSVFATYGCVAVGFDMTEPVIFDGQMAVIFNHFGTVVFREQIQIFLGVNVDLLFVRLVFKPQLVTTLALVGLGFQSGSGFVFRQRIRRRVGGVVGSSGNDWLVRVTVQKRDNYFVANSGQRDKAILAARPALADS